MTTYFRPRLMNGMYMALKRHTAGQYDLTPVGVDLGPGAPSFFVTINRTTLKGWSIKPYWLQGVQIGLYLKRSEAIAAAALMIADKRAAQAEVVAAFKAAEAR